MHQLNLGVLWAGKRWANNCEKEKVQLSSFDSFKPWGLLHNYSNSIQLAPVHYIAFHSSRLRREPWPGGRGETWKSKLHFTMKSSPHAVSQLTRIHIKFWDTEVRSSRRGQRLSHCTPSAPLLCCHPSQQMERGIILGRRASEGAH